ncbi:MAG: hypothetical protein M0P71_00745 [Melioribacteraceae bacterium]|nr:hypothetical protein [Melioribacteraceae bacterium]
MERYVSSHNRKFFIHSILYKEKTFVSYFLTPIDNPEEKSYFTFTEQMMSPFSENDTKGFDIISDFCKKKCTNCSIYNCELAKKIIEMTPIIKKKVNNN